MNKISKKDQDPNQVDKDRSALGHILARKSKHFEPGTKVVIAQQRFTVVEYRGRHVIVQDEDGGAYVIHNPYFMQWR